MLTQGSSDQRFTAKVQPSNWQNPPPASRYDFLVIGGGASGVAAAREAKLCGAQKVALIEATRLGGDRLAHGAVPMLSLLAGSREAAQVSDVIVRQRAFTECLEMMRRKRAKLADAISADRLTEEGIDLFFGHARFDTPTEVVVEQSGELLQLEFTKALITSGARPTIPQLPGFETISYRTPETIFELERIPERLAILGAGAQGVEMAQAFARFGCRVSLIDKSERLLPEAEHRASELLERALAEDGVQIKLHTSVVGVQSVNRAIQLRLNRFGNDELLEVDELLVAVGRTPNIENLSLELAGVETVQNGIFVNDTLQSTSKQIYACGDVIGERLSRQTAEAQAIMAVRNALTGSKKRLSQLIVPWVLFTQPEVAHVGMNSELLNAQEIAFRRLSINFTEQERGVIEEEDGELELLVNSDGIILGASAIHPLAGELLAEVTLAMAHHLPLQALAGIHRPFATRIRALSQLAEEELRLRPKSSRLKRFLIALKKNRPTGDC